MSRYVPSALLLGLACLVPVRLGVPVSPSTPPRSPGSMAREVPPTARGGSVHPLRLPLRFEVNRGQSASPVRFLARTGAGTVFLTGTGAVLALGRTRGPGASQAPAVLRLGVEGRLPGARFVPGDRLPGSTSYLLGRDPARWHTGIEAYGRVTWKGVRPGIDLAFHGNAEGRLEYDVVVGPGRDPAGVVLHLKGADRIRRLPGGALAVDVGGREVRQLAPVVYQVIDGRRRRLPGRYRLLGGDRIAFSVPGRDPGRPLVIDPTLLYASYLGGSATEEPGLTCLGVDAAGDSYLVGDTFSSDFPATAGALQTSLDTGSREDVFVAKLDPTGTQLVWATYLGGSNYDMVKGMTLDGSGHVFAVGWTGSTDFPVTSGALGTTLGGNQDAFVAELAADGASLVYATYLGGLSDNDEADGIAVDASGDAYVTGFTNSPDFPLTPGAFQTSLAGAYDAFVVELDPAGTQELYGTLLGGSKTDVGQGVAVDGSGSAYVTGYSLSTDLPVTAGAFQPALAGNQDAFVARLAPDGSKLTYLTYLGGSLKDNLPVIVLDGSGDAYVGGSTWSADFPVTAGVLQGQNAGPKDGVVVEVAPDGKSLVYGTYLGGSGDDHVDALAIDASGDAYLGGGTGSTDFPLTGGAYQSTNAGNGDAFLAVLDPGATQLIYSTLYGGSQMDQANGIHLGPGSDITLAGWTWSNDLPGTTNTGKGEDLFVARFGTAPLGISPATATVPPRGSQPFTVAGGTPPYTWQVSTNRSLGTVDQTGKYTAGPNGQVTDTVEVSDSAGRAAYATVKVGPGVTISPASATVPPQPQGHVAFSASGGDSTQYTYSFVTNRSGGGLVSTTGDYASGPVGGVTDVIQVADRLGNTAQAQVYVTPVAVDGGTVDGGTADAGTADAGTADAGTADAGTADAGTADAGTADAGTADAGTADAGTVDAGTADAGTADAGTVDAGTVDAGTVDAGTVDAGTVDAGTVDAGTVDAGTVDAGTVDAGTVDAGTVDAGPSGQGAGGGASAPGCGCSASGGGRVPGPAFLGLLCLGAVLLPRRRRRR